MNELLQYNGSLLSSDGFILSSYDLSKSHVPKDVQYLNSSKINNGSLCPFYINYSEVEHLTIVNGMGVTLGDSIIGISVLDVIKKINPNINIRVIRPKSAPLYVDEIYHLAESVIDDIHYMPFDISLINSNGLNIDIGNQLYWPDFHTMEMHDFFIKELGVIISEELNSYLANSWLKNIVTKKILFKNYVLFSPSASTPVRSIPNIYHYDIVDMLYKRFGMLIVGFTDIDHPHYINVSEYSLTTIDFVSIVRYAHHVYTCDSSALHISAGFNIPTTCIFNTIPPELRVKYYNECESYFIGDGSLFKIQNSEEEELLNLVKEKFKIYFYN